MKEKEMFVVKSEWEESVDFNSSNGSDVECVCDNLTTAIDALKAFAVEKEEQIKEDCEQYNVEFDKENLSVFHNYGEDEHYNPNVKLQYFDENTSVRFSYSAEVVLRPYKK